MTVQTIIRPLQWTVFEPGTSMVEAPDPRPTSKITPQNYVTSSGVADILNSFILFSTRDKIDFELAQLVELVEKEDLKGFTQAVNQINWQLYSSNQMLQVVHLALTAGAHLTARQVAQKAAERFPTDPKVQHYHQILRPPQVIHSDLPADPGVAQNARWLKEHTESHRGLWIGLRDGEVLATGTSFAEVRAQVGSLKNSRILVTKV